MNKLTKTFFSLFLGSAFLVGTFSAISKAKTVDAVEAETSTYYYRGTANGWEVGTAVTVGSSTAVSFTFSANEQFKFDNGSWSDSLGAGAVSGTAAAYFSGSDNIVCDVAGSYNVYIANSTIYIDLKDGENFYFSGSTNSWGVKTDSPIALNGSAVSFALTQTTEFKFRTNHEWKIALGIGAISGSVYSDTDETYYAYYNCFSGTDNIYVRAPGTYYFSIKSSSTAHSLSIEVYNPNGGTAYVLDLNGNLLNANHNAHVYNNDYGIGTNWPGASMNKTASTTNIYEYTYISLMSEIIFNANDGSSGTENYAQSLSGKDGKCLILTWDYDTSVGKWSNETWLSLEAARFIDKYMKFETAHEDAGAGTGQCKNAGWYSAAKTAYSSLSNTAKGDVSGFTRVSERLSAWARANGDTFSISNGVGSFSAARVSISITGIGGSNNAMIIVVVIASLGILTAGAYYFFKKSRKSEE